MVVSIITSYFLVYIIIGCPEAASCWSLQQIYLSVNGSLPCLYNVQLENKRESELKDWCWDTDHLFPGQEDHFLDIWNNITIHFFILVMHDLNVSIHTLLPLSCHIIWRKYEGHVAWLYYIYCIYANLLFLQTIIEIE